MRTAIITGITGQDGAYLAELLLEKGYTVYGTFRRTSSVMFWRIEELGIDEHPNFHRVEYDLTDLGSTIRLLREDRGRRRSTTSRRRASWRCPSTSRSPPARSPASGALHLLEAIRIVDPKIRFYQASTSEMFGKVQEIPQNEQTPFYPRSPYGVAKLYAHWMTINYRESYGIFGTSGILFNHESPLRGLRVRHAQDHGRRSPRSSWASRRCWSSATSTPSATGATRRTTSRACGGCCRPRRRTPTCSRPAAPRPCATS